MTRVLVVEDEESYSEALAYMLRKEGFEVAIAADGNTALTEFDRNGADIVLLDLMLPGIPGTEVCRTIRQSSSVPVIMVSAKDDEVDQILGLELGADDYVTKPFSFRELVARIRAVARRTAPAGGGATAPTGDDPTAPQVIGPLRIDRRTRRVHMDGDEVQLTAKEFDLLAFLATDIGAVHTRTEILENVWDAHWYGPTKTVDAHVASLRKKLGAHDWIQAVRGVGFRLEPPA
ncbi:MAG TPA: DNA-binding response regulator [Acidimicrobiaceae bacterium]|nr:DNA-binding response regulator [Acidimicrobiaceae bacterium]